MKILLASSYANIKNKFLHVFDEALDFDTAVTGDEIFRFLKENKYDAFISEHQIADIDFLSIVKFINSTDIKSINGKKLPLFVIFDENKKFPTLLSSNYKFKIIDLSIPINIKEKVDNYQIDKPAVLIIEDDEDIAEGMKITLQKDYNVDVCSCGKQGLLLLKKNEYDLILLDLMMPEMSGEDVLKAIRVLKPTQSIIIESAKSESDIKQKMIMLGANDYLTKPFSPEQLNKSCRVVLTQDLYQYELDLKERKLDFIISNIWESISALENDEMDVALEALYDIVYSMPEKINEDLRLEIIVNRYPKNQQNT